MAIPDFQTMMLPILKYSSRMDVVVKRDCVEHLANEFALTEEERITMLPSGNQSVLLNRVSWAVTYLIKAGLLEKINRGVWRITNTGKQELMSSDFKIDKKYHKKFDNFNGFHVNRKN